jgi:hypothetical protein
MALLSRLFNVTEENQEKCCQAGWFWGQDLNTAKQFNMAMKQRNEYKHLRLSYIILYT